MRARAEELGCPMRYLWVAAIDQLLALPQSEIEQRTLAIELMARKDFAKLNKAGPGETQSVLANVAASFAQAAQSQGAAANKTKKKTTRKGR